VVREADDGDLGPRVDDLLRVDARDVGDHELRSVDAVRGDQAMPRQKPLKLAPEEEVDPNQQDRCHSSTLAAVADTDNRLVTLERGLQLIRAGEYFEAHEELEDEWRGAPDAERDFLQGLVHVAVAWHHAGRDNRPGCERQLEKATRRLSPYTPRHRGVDVARVLAEVDRARTLVESGSLTLPRPEL
jgi:predicted metal-dependent hydrolase